MADCYDSKNDDKNVKIRFVFKSGHVEEVTVEKLTVNKSGGIMSSISWTDAYNNQKMVYVNLDEVAGIFRIA